jgi:phosphate transport system ATP-binding protein
MSIFDNVASGLRLNGVRNKRTLAEASSALTAANLWNEVKDRLGRAHRPVRRPTAAAVHRAPLLRAPGPADGRAVLGPDPISTLAIEDLIGELKEQFTVVIVTHNMQQAARVSARRPSQSAGTGQIAADAEKISGGEDLCKSGGVEGAERDTISH